MSTIFGEDLHDLKASSGSLDLLTFPYPLPEWPVSHAIARLAYIEVNIEIWFGILAPRGSEEEKPPQKSNPAKRSSSEQVFLTMPAGFLTHVTAQQAEVRVNFSKQFMYKRLFSPENAQLFTILFAILGEFVRSFS